MSNISSKIAFYVQLWNDYKTCQLNEAVESSYIYRYLKKRKDEQAEHITAKDRKDLKGSSRIDAYVYIQSLYMAYAGRQIKKGELIGDLEVLIEEKSNLRSFSGEIKKVEKDAGALNELHDKLLDRCLRKDIQVFFNDIGYVEKMKKGELPLADKARKNNEILDLYFGFISESDWDDGIMQNTLLTGTPTAKIDDRGYIEDCKRLFEDLQQERRAVFAFMPLFLDEQSALGIFIIGRSLLNINARDYIRDKKGKLIMVENPPCAYYLAVFDETIGGAYGEDEEEKTINASFEMSFEILDWADSGGLEDLIERYTGIKMAGIDFERYPRNHNKSMPMTAVRNPVFKKYFIGRLDEDMVGRQHESVRESIVEHRKDQMYSARKQARQSRS